MDLSDQEKSKIICEKLGLCWHIAEHKLTDTHSHQCTLCEVKGVSYADYRFKRPDLFTPDGQVVLAKALDKEENKEVASEFDDFLYHHQDYDWYNYPVESMREVVKEEKLASLVYEFIESEGK